jgi:hypothetical protein
LEIGLFIIVERQYGFGDVVCIAALGSEVGVSGTVEEVTLRVTRLRTVNGEDVIVPQRADRAGDEPVPRLGLRGRRRAGTEHR